MNIKSDIYVIKNLIARKLTPKSITQVDSLYLKWCNIRRGSKESSKEYTAKAVQFQSDLNGTHCCITNEELVRKWHQWLCNFYYEEYGGQATYNPVTLVLFDVST